MAVFTARGRGVRAVPVLLAATSVLIAGVGAGPAAAAQKKHVTETSEHALIHWINVQRQAHHLAPVVRTTDLTVFAHRQVEVMAQQDRLFTDPRLGTEVHGWLTLGEAVARGSRLSAVEKALMSGHDRVNLLSPGFRQIGVGTAGRDGLLYVTVILRRPVNH